MYTTLCLQDATVNSDTGNTKMTDLKLHYAVTMFECMLDYTHSKWC